MNKIKKSFTLIVSLLLIICFVMTGCGKNKEDVATPTTTRPEAETLTMPETTTELPETMPEAFGNDEDEVIETTPSSNESSVRYEDFDWSSIPDYSGQDVIEINGDVPMFTEEEKQYGETYIHLSELDDLGRCQVAMGLVGQETEPTEERGDISKVHPSGWKQMQMSNGTYLYNRSHLLMFALTGLNDDERNLITGTEYFNQKLMLGYESMALWVVDNQNAHVVYRVTPVYDGNNLVAKGVLMEAYCIEYPEDCEYCVFVYNVEPGVTINYATGEAWES